MPQSYTDGNEIELDVQENENSSLIQFDDQGHTYSFTNKDFRMVEDYCENECMGIQFLINANLLRRLVSCALKLGYSIPFSLDALSSKEVEQTLTNNQEMESIRNNFGTTDIKKVARIAAKQTYKFITKS